MGQRDKLFELANVQRGSQLDPRLQALQDRTWSRACGLSLLWSIIGGVLVDWAWWRVLLTTVVGCVAIVFVMGIASAFTDVSHWPRTLRERTRFMNGFFVACASVLVTTWWLTQALPFLAATAGLCLVFTFWAWPPTEPPEPKTRQIELPVEIRALASRLPSPPHPRIEKLANDALEDWQHLMEVLATDDALAAETEAMALETTANAGLQRLLESSLRAQQLLDIAGERPDDAHAPDAANAALHILSELGSGLHDTTSALLRYVATRRPDEVTELRMRVDELSALAEVEETLAPSAAEGRQRREVSAPVR